MTHDGMKEPHDNPAVDGLHDAGVQYPVGGDLLEVLLMKDAELVEVEESFRRIEGLRGIGLIDEDYYRNEKNRTEVTIRALIQEQAELVEQINNNGKLLSFTQKVGRFIWRRGR